MNETVIKNWEVSLVRFIQILVHIPVSLTFSYIAITPLTLIDGALCNFNEYIKAFFSFDGDTQLTNILLFADTRTISASLGSEGLFIAWSVFLISSAIQIKHEFIGGMRKAFVMRFWLAIKRWSLTLHDDSKS
ncbi:MAG: hypothetical protein Q7T29_05750 [Gallionella sp.]|nr:hypothetical protein [Gallionella sp.]